MSEIKSKKIKLFGTHHLVCSLANIKKMTFLYDKAFLNLDILVQWPSQDFFSLCLTSSFYLRIMLIFINKLYGITWSPNCWWSKHGVCLNQTIYIKLFYRDGIQLCFLEIGWYYRHQLPHQFLCGAEDQTQVILHARQVFCKLNICTRSNRV